MSNASEFKSGTARDKRRSSNGGKRGRKNPDGTDGGTGKMREDEGSSRDEVK